MRREVLSIYMYDTAFAGTPDFPLANAIALSIVLFSMVLIVLTKLVEKRYGGRSRAMAEPLQNQVGKRVVGIIGTVVAYFVMGLFAFMTIAPIIWLIISSFKTHDGVPGQPGRPSPRLDDGQLPRRMEPRRVRQAHRQLVHLHPRRHARDHLLLHPRGIRLREDQIERHPYPVRQLCPGHPPLHPVPHGAAVHRGVAARPPAHRAVPGPWAY